MPVVSNLFPAYMVPKDTFQSTAYGMQCSVLGCLKALSCLPHKTLFASMYSEQTTKLLCGEMLWWQSQTCLRQMVTVGFTRRMECSRSTEWTSSRLPLSCWSWCHARVQQAAAMADVPATRRLCPAQMLACAQTAKIIPQ